MKKPLANLLVDPVGKTPLSLEIEDEAGGEVISGALLAANGSRYPITRSIPRFFTVSDEKQRQTSQTFGYKWGRTDSYGSQGMTKTNIRWRLEKYNFGSLEEWVDFYNQRSAILDVGCGSGYSSSLYLCSPQWEDKAMWVGADISEAVDVARERLGHLQNAHFIQGDALQLPFPDQSFDAIFSEGVLHHTPSTRQAILSTAKVLKTGGEYHFYVYRKKGPVREFTDDYIRQQIAPLSDEEAWESMRSLTMLGKILSELNQEVEIPEDIPLLGIKAGKHDLQRLVYWNFAKLYWNQERTFEENVHVNFDWYRPHYAHRQTAEEVHAWCDEARLSIYWFREEEAGFTVKAVKN